MDITKLVDKYGQTIAHSLQIASTQVYAQLSWYYRINAILTLIQLLIVILFTSLSILIGYLICKKNKWFKDNYSQEQIIIAIFLVSIFIGFLTGLILALNAMYYLFVALYPQYGILHDVIQKITGQ